MKITCEFCCNEHIPSLEENEFISTSKEKGMTFIMLECKECGQSFSINPQNSEEPNDFHNNPDLLRTPLSGCLGFVSLIEDENDFFYGCGESGAIWKKKENLFRDIENIIEEYPHRKNCYSLLNNEWVPNKNEPKDIEDQITKEKLYKLDNYTQD